MWCVIEKPGWEESAFYAVNHVWAKFDFKGGLDSMRWHAVCRLSLLAAASASGQNRVGC
jgi:hypothetical protein